MRKRLTIIAALVCLFSTSAADEDSATFRDFLSSEGCVWDRLGVRYCGPGKCVFDGGRFIRCAPEDNAGVSINYNNDASCGPGACLAGSTGEVYCSSASGGYAWYTSNGTVDCTAGCVLGSPDFCVDGVVDEPWRQQRTPRRLLYTSQRGYIANLCLSGDFLRANSTNQHQGFWENG